MNFKKGTYEISDEGNVVLKNWFSDGDLEISTMDLTSFGKRKKK